MLYQKFSLADGSPIGAPDDLPALLQGELPADVLANPNAFFVPPLAEFDGVGFKAVDESSGRYVTKERFGDLFPAIVLMNFTNLRKHAAQISYPIGTPPTDAQTLGLLEFEQGAEIIDRSDSVNLLDPRLPSYLQASAQLQAWPGYDITQEILRIQGNILP